MAASVRAKLKTAWRTTAVASVVAVSALTAFGSVTPAAADAPVPPFIPPTADWLTAVNYYRAMAGLPSVAENPTYSAGAYNHSCYMLNNGISHSEVPGYPGYTAEGNAAGSNGNVAVSSVFGTSARTHVELWMTGPFHAIGMLRSNLTSVGFGKCDSQATAPWKSGATLDVIRGIVPGPQRSNPVLFPGNGTTTSLDRFITESPNPLTYCGWSGSAGLPVLALMPEPVGNVSATMFGPSGPVQVCVLSALNTDGVAKAILQGENAVVVIPRSPLAAGAYGVNVNSSARAVSWSFTVDPMAATGIMPPPVAEAGAVQSQLQAIEPVRLVDTRIGLGTYPLNAGWDRRVQIAGRGGVPLGATAVVANLTIVNPTGAGYLSAWNCGPARPTVSSLNYGTGDVVPNAAVIPLAADGSICLYSHATTDLTIDVSGYLAAQSPGKYSPVLPQRIMDTRIGQGPSLRLAAGQTAELQVAGQAGVPGDATVAALNVTSTDVYESGYVTVYPCSATVPLVSSLNPIAWRTRANLVVAPLSARGTVCIYSLKDTELIVDVSGYWAPSSSAKFTPSTPFRFTDTRDLWRPAINAGTGGTRVANNQVINVQMAGVRGIPTNAKAVSVNLTVVDGMADGYLSVWGCGQVPNVSNVNFAQWVAVANAAVIPLSADGRMCLTVVSAAHVIIDVNGWWS